jgi:hypothetical protein
MIEDLIRRARRRLIVNEALSQSALACAFLVGGLALILIVGTRYLEWWTLGLFAAAGIAIGAVRIRRSIPGEYAAAVQVDKNAALKDSLSTALWFSQHAAPFPEAQIIQRSQAETAAQSVDLDTAIPFTMPRSLYVMAALVLLATGLIAFRFVATRGLDLRAPLTEVFFEDLAARPQDKKANLDNAKQKRMEDAESLLAKLGVPLNPEDKKDEAALDKAIDQALEGAQTPANKGEKGEAGKPGESQPAGLEQSPNGDPLDGKEGESKDQSGDKNQGKDGGKGDNKGAPKDGNGDNGSLMSKLKDAVNNMFSKPGDKGSDKKDGQKGQAKGDQKSGEKGQQSQGKDQKGQESQAQDGEPSGDAQQDGQQAQGKAGSKSSEQSAQAGSGVGSQDGAKDLKAAEQLKAMGKLSEIIGKRSSQVTGETTIEVQSGNQSLRTNYSTKTATHGEADSDVNRDEIPVSLQPYVQSYFEQVRKASQQAKPKAAAPPANPGK